VGGWVFFIVFFNRCYRVVYCSCRVRTSFWEGGREGGGGGNGFLWSFVEFLI
jgi:hypothetical protein